MITTINEVKSFNLCKSGLKNLLSQAGTDYLKNELIEVSSLVGGENTISDIIWLMCNKRLTHELVELSVYCAELIYPY